MKLKNIFPTALLVCFISSCQDMMDLKSDSFIFEEDHTLASPNDSLYSVMGILTQVQKIGTRYILFGELRGDLMCVTDDAPADLKEISDFNVSADNAYLSKRDFYNIINNCNYALTNMDTTVTEHNVNVMMPEYTAIKTIRAWVYLQMGLAYGSVKYIEEPILSQEASDAEYPEIELDELVDRLIADIGPYAGRRVPDYGIDDGRNTHNFFIEPDLLLADMYLFKNRYEDAARSYYACIARRRLSIQLYANTYATSQALAAGDQNFIYSLSEEIVAEIPYSTDTRKDYPDLVNMTYHLRPQIVPAEWWCNALATSPHFHIDRVGISSISGFLEGDLRGRYIFLGPAPEVPVSIASSALLGTAKEKYLISKYFISSAINNTLINPDNPAAEGHFVDEIPLYRNSHLYLRYAEAVNRLGKPTLAFAVLKYGLRAEVLGDKSKVDSLELADNAAWTDFYDAAFDNNYGTAMRGRGLGIPLLQSTYAIPELSTRNDSIVWVEDAIVDEMAAETQFEGNRFFDLLRIARHRGSDAYLAEKVSRRFSSPESVRSRLSSQDTWWIK